MQSSEKRLNSTSYAKRVKLHQRINALIASVSKGPDPTNNKPSCDVKFDFYLQNSTHIFFHKSKIIVKASQII